MCKEIIKCSGQTWQAYQHSKVAQKGPKLSTQVFLIIWAASFKNVNNRSKFHEKMAFFCHYLAMNGRLWVRKKFSTHI